MKMMMPMILRKTKSINNHMYSKGIKLRFSVLCFYSYVFKVHGYSLQIKMKGVIIMANLHDYKLSYETTHCLCCGKDLSQTGFTVDHFIPKDLGGSPYRNLFPLCYDCNVRKSNLLLHPEDAYPNANYAVYNLANDILERYLREVKAVLKNSIVTMETKYNNCNVEVLVVDNKSFDFNLDTGIVTLSYKGFGEIHTFDLLTFVSTFGSRGGYLNGKFFKSKINGVLLSLLINERIGDELKRVKKEKAYRCSTKNGKRRFEKRRRYYC